MPTTKRQTARKRRQALLDYAQGKRCARNRPAGPEHPWRAEAFKPEAHLEGLRGAHRRYLARKYRFSLPSRPARPIE